MSLQKIAFIGAGNMSYAIISGLLAKGYAPEHITATNRNPTKLANVASTLKVNTTSDNLAAIDNADVVILAVKPQMIADLCRSIAESNVDYKNKLFISVAAGVTIERLHTLLDHPVKLVRAMPNTPSLLGKGVAGLYAKGTNEQDNQFVEQLFKSAGIVCWLEHEKQINDITAISGSSPAYFFLFMEAIEEKAKQLGFSQSQARQLVQQVALGASEMVAQQDLPISQLRANVTSKGGTTAAAINHFEKHNLTETVSSAMDQCIARAEEMEQQF